MVPPLPGTFSAWGMLMTQPRVDLTRTRVTPLDRTSPAAIEAGFRDLEREATRRLTDQGFEPGTIDSHRRSADMRYHGQEHTVRVAVATANLNLADLEAAFHEIHRRQYTFALADTPLEIVNFRTISTVATRRPALSQAVKGGDGTASDLLMGRRGVDFGDGRRCETALYQRSRLPAGFAAVGPAIVEEPSATTLIHPGQTLEVDRYGNLLISGGGQADR